MGQLLEVVYKEVKNNDNECRDSVAHVDMKILFLDNLSDVSTI